jgi:hypothetical protein
MHRKSTTNWLNLLLAMIMVLGPWPVFSDSARGDGCCTTAMESAPAGAHGGCKNDHAQDAPCVNHCCPAAHCATTVFLPSSIDIPFPRYGNTVPSSVDRSYSASAVAPPTPPPIAFLSA